MELNTEMRTVLIAQTHDDAVVGPGGDLEVGRKAIAIHNQRVVAGRLEAVWQSFKKPTPAVKYFGGLAVDRFRSPHHPAAVDRGDRLVAEADPEQGQVRSGANQLHAHPGVFGRARPWGDDDRARRERWRREVEAGRQESL